jgi:hypothetical protein
MDSTRLRRLLYKIKNRYATRDNAVVAVAFFIAASWAWGSVSVMERNYKLQREIDNKEQQLKLTDLETARLKYEQKYYQSDEYKEMAVRQRLGLVQLGEHVIILPANSEGAKQWDANQQPKQVTAQTEEKPSNFQQWMTFLLGGNRRD